MFKGQTKELFEKWYEKSGIPQSSEIEFYAGDSSGYMGIWLDNFYKLPFSMQQGVYLQFLREQGMVITIDNFRESIDDDICFFYSIRDIREKENIATVKNWDYDTALKSGITKAGELLNERSRK